MVAGPIRWRAFVSAVSLASMLSAACGRDVSVARPTETGYGEVTPGEPGDAPDAEVPTAAPRDPGDVDTLPDARDGGVTLVPDPVVPDVVRAPASSVSLATTRELYASGEPRMHLTRPADLTQVQGPLPVVVWANRACSRDDSAGLPLFERWASAGFVVLSLYAEPSRGLVGLQPRLGPTTTADHTRLIDWVVAKNADGPYAGKLDVERIVVAGNTCGGLSALQVASADARPAGVFVLSGSSAATGVNAELMRSITMPVGYVVGGDEDRASAGATRDYAALQDGVPAMVARRREGSQQTVSTDPAVLAQIAEIALNWMDLVLYGTEPAYSALTSPTPCSACTAGDWTLDTKRLETLKR